jgi:DNA-binding XRE family transcriptional regulator
MARYEGEPVRLPPRPFLYTVDQLANLLGVTELTVENNYLFYTSNEWGKPSPDLLVARNIASSHDKPDWRVEEKELKRWMKRKGFRFYG